MPKSDILVIGHGLAGTLLTYFLKEQGFSVTLIGSADKNSSSRIAAGIIHPITGRRIVKSWMADIFIPFAEETYARCESLTENEFYSRKEIIELVKEPGEMNEWVSRSSDPDVQSLLNILPALPHREQLQAFPYSVSVHGGFLDTDRFLDAMNNYLAKSCAVLDENISIASLHTEADRVVCNELEAERVIFCEGYQGMFNPYWKALPWQPSKGEILKIRCEQLDAREIITRKIFILPLADHIYKVGSTYAWDSLNEIPTEVARDKLCHELKKILNVPFEVIAHQAAVRPTVKERRPFLGMHPLHPRVGIFNGLGTKGVMTGPWLANHFAEHLQKNSPLMPEVDIMRYHTKLENQNPLE